MENKKRQNEERGGRRRKREREEKDNGEGEGGDERGECKREERGVKNYREKRRKIKKKDKLRRRGDRITAKKE